MVAGLDETSLLALAKPLPSVEVDELDSVEGVVWTVTPYGSYGVYDNIDPQHYSGVYGNVVILCAYRGVVGKSRVFNMTFTQRYPLLDDAVRLASARHLTTRLVSILNESGVSLSTL
jgi:hypothetical protein